MNENGLYYPTNAPMVRRLPLTLTKEGSQALPWVLLIAGGRRRRCREHRRSGSHRGSFSRQLLFLVLELVEPVIDSALRKQFLVRAFFAQTALVENQDTVGMLNRAQPVRDH